MAESDPPPEAESDRRPTTLVRTAAATYGTNFAAAVLGLANVYIVARALGPNGRGDVAFVMAIALLVHQLVSLSLQESNANLGGANASDRPSLATNSIFLGLGLGSLGGLAVALLVFIFPSVGGEVSRPVLWLGLCIMPVLLVKLYLQYLLQSDYHFALPNISWVAGPLTTACVNGTMAVLGAVTVGSAVAVWIAGQLFGMFLLIFGAARHFGFGRPDIGLVRRTWNFGAKAHVGRSLSTGCYKADQWFIGAAVGSHELGLYSVARAWSELLFYLPGVITSLQRPDLVRADRAQAADIAMRVFRRAAILGIGAAVLLAAAAPMLCVSAFGEEFRGSVAELRVLALAAPGIVAIELLSNAFIAQQRPFVPSIAYGLAFVVSIVLNLLLVPSHGGFGAAIASSAAYTAGGAIAAMLFLRIFRARARDFLPTFSDLGWYVRKVRTLGRPPPAPDIAES